MKQKEKNTLGSLPVLEKNKGSSLPNLWDQAFPLQSANRGQIPNASLIYGIASSALFAISLYFLFTGMWLTGLLLLLPCGAFLGYALHFLRYPT